MNACSPIRGWRAAVALVLLCGPLVAVNAASAMPARANHAPASSAPVNCHPSPNAAIVVGATVTCAFAAPAGGGTFLSWTASDFTPATSSVSTQSFAAASTGTGDITVAWSTPEDVTESADVSYSIGPSTAIASCSVANGTSIAVGHAVSCTFHGASGDSFVGWGASLFSPSDSTDQAQSFSAVSTGAGLVTAFWTTDTDVEEQESYSFPVVPNLSIASCSLPSGDQVNQHSSVTCTFHGGAGDTFVGWGANLFSPDDSTSATQLFTPLALGAGSITALWDISGGAEDQETFNYQIATLSSGIAPTCVTGQTVAINGYVNWTNLPVGTINLRWGDGATEHGRAVFPAAHRYAMSGVYTISLTAGTDHQTTTASATVTVGAGRVSCTYRLVPKPIAPTGTLRAHATVTITIAVTGAGATAEPFAPVWLSFSPAKGGGAVTVAGGCASPLIKTDLVECTTNTAGTLTAKFTAPKHPPTSGTDTLTLHTAPTGGATITDQYKY